MVVESSQIAFKLLGSLQVDVEGDDVDRIKAEIFGGRIVDVGDQRSGVLHLHGPTETCQKALDPGRAIPADDLSGNFVTDGVAEHGGMPGTGADTGPDPLLDRRPRLTVIEEGDVLLPGEPDHHPEAVREGCV